jgi:hypothetical protein
MPRHTILPLIAIAGLGCAPSLDAELSLVSEPRILALRAEPAEAKEGQTVTLSALVADPEARELPADFGLCVARKNLTELGPIAPECLYPEAGDARVSLGSGTSIPATVSKDACRLFGPLRPDPKPGEPAGRAADADTTGGYHQPVVAYLEPSAPVLGAIRLNCGLVQADREKVEAYNLRWTPNTNPTLQALYIQVGQGWQSLESDAETPFVVTSGTTYPLKLEWPECAPRSESESPEAFTQKSAPCSGEESYLYFAPETQSFQERTESMSAAWYATHGTFRTRRSIPTSAFTSENQWTAPSSSGAVSLWLVLRDGRGGVGWGRYSFQVR